MYQHNTCEGTAPSCTVLGHAPDVAGFVQVSASIPAADLEALQAFIRERGGNDSPQLQAARAFALAAVAQAVANGARPACSNCGAVEKGAVKFKKCARCKSAQYCQKACQLSHWHAAHKLQCIQHGPCNSHLLVSVMSPSVMMTRICVMETEALFGALVNCSPLACSNAPCAAGTRLPFELDHRHECATRDLLKPAHQSVQCPVHKGKRPMAMRLQLANLASYTSVATVLGTSARM